MSADLVVNNDVVYFKILDLKLAPLPSTKRSAKLDLMGLSSQEYVSFRDNLHFSMEDLRSTLNEEYFNHGIILPYNVDEIRSSVTFRERAMYILMEIEEGVDRYFEETFWDERALEEQDIESFGDIYHDKIYDGCSNNPNYADEDGDGCDYYWDSVEECGDYDEGVDITAFEGCCVCKFVTSGTAFSWY